MNDSNLAAKLQGLTAANKATAPPPLRLLLHLTLLLQMLLMISKAPLLKTRPRRMLRLSVAVRSQQRSARRPSN